MKRDLDSYEALIAPHLARLRAHARRRVANNAGADDLVQATLRQRWKHLHELRNPSAVLTWRSRISRGRRLLVSLLAEEAATVSHAVAPKVVPWSLGR